MKVMANMSPMLSSLTHTSVQFLPAEVERAWKPITREQEVAARIYGDAFGYACPGRSSVSIKGGRVGLASIKTEPARIVCDFFYTFTPFILRPNQYHFNGIRYQLIGESYIDRIIYGEAFEVLEIHLEAFTFVWITDDLYQGYKMILLTYSVCSAVLPSANAYRAQLNKWIHIKSPSILATGMPRSAFVFLITAHCV